MDTPIDQATLPSDGKLNDPADFPDDPDFISKFEVIPSQPGDPNFVGPIALVVEAVGEDGGTEVSHQQSTRAPDDIVSQYIYLETHDAYLRESDKQILKPTALNRVHKLTYPGDQHIPAATTAFDAAPDKRVASGKGWLPIADPIIELDGVRYANTYAGIRLPPELGDGDITEWLALCDHIYGNHVELIIDHWAFSIQQPLEKIRWQILVQGKPRNGKSLTIKPLIKIWGSAGVSLAPDEVEAGWADGLVGRKFVCMEEVYMPENKRFFNNLKTKLANDYVERLNVKRHGQVVQQNLYSMVLFTNHLDALHFDENDDKLLVIESNNERWPKERYKALAQAIDKGNLANKIYHFLLHRDVSNFEYGSLPVRTDAAIRMAEASLPDYQRAVSEMIDDQVCPFNKELFTMQALRDELKHRNYKHGDKGLVDILIKKGFQKYRGQKKIEKVPTKTPTFWTREDLKGKSDAELYQFYQISK